MSEIKFRKYFVSNGHIKARITYSINTRIDGKACVTLYAKDYNRDLGKIFKEYYINESDMREDYSEQGRVILFEDNKYYLEARKVAESIASIASQWRAD